MTDLKPLVSVIIPAYNCESTIFECVSSVLNQTYSNLQVIVINDGSTDNTLSILNLFTDNRLCVISQKNKGASAAKNIGLRMSKGEFIQYLDADDFLSLDKIDSQVRCISSFSNCIAVCSTVAIGRYFSEIIGEIDNDAIRAQGSGIDFLLRLLGSEGRFAMVQPNAYLIPMAVIQKTGDWEIDYYPCPDEDGEYFSRVLLNSVSVIYTPGTNYYRKIKGQMSISQTYSLIRAINQLATTVRKFDNIYKFRSDQIVRDLFLFNVSEIVYQFGSLFPEIIQIARTEIEKQGFTKFRLLTKTKFSRISMFIGIEYTLKIRRIFHNMLNKLDRFWGVRKQ
jgi:glycosyltransferase involved in cell wall biosynthesis